MNSNGQESSESRQGKKYLHKTKNHSQVDFDCLKNIHRNKLLCDVVLVAEGMEILAHKLILATCSLFFYWKFSNDKKSGLLDRIEINNISYSTLSMIVDYLYKSEILITDDNIEELLAAAQMFALRDLQKVCQEFVVNNLNPRNCIKFFNMAKYSEHSGLFYKYIGIHVLDVMKNKDYLNLTFEEVLDVISNDAVYTAEENILEFVIRWVQSNIASRKAYIYDLMQNIRFSLMSLKKILQRFEKEQWLTSDPAYNSFLVKICRSCLLDENTSFVPNPRQSPKLLLVAGVRDDRFLSIEVYDFFKKVWLNWPNHFRFGCHGEPRIAILGTKIYCFEDGEVSSIKFSNPTRLKVSKCKSMIQNRKGFNVAVLEDSIYAVGGDGVEVYNESTKEWRKIANMKEKSNVGLGTLNGILYVIGIRKSSAPIYTWNADSRWNADSVSYSVECYNPEENSWYTIPSIKCYNSGIAALDDKLYVVGGEDSLSYLPNAKTYNPTCWSWNCLPEMDVARSTPGVIAIDGQLYVIGGFNNSGNLASVEIYNPKSNTWSMLPSLMNTAKRHVVAALIDECNITLP